MWGQHSGDCEAWGSTEGGDAVGCWAEEQVAVQEAMPEAPVREKAPRERFDLKMSRDLIFFMPDPDNV